MEKQPIVIFWFRRDLRLSDNHGLHAALNSGYSVLPIFIFDNDIISNLAKDDARITFIHQQLAKLSEKLAAKSSALYVARNEVTTAWGELLDTFDVQAVYANEDYEPYAIQRDSGIKQLLAQKNIDFHLNKDQVIFAKNDVLKADQTPYTIYTPFKNKWLSQFKPLTHLPEYRINAANFLSIDIELPSLAELGFSASSILVKPYDTSDLMDYEQTRNFPALDSTSYLSPHLRFGTVSIREIIRQIGNNPIFLSELIWREFFMQILYHFPHVVNASFKAKYDAIPWRNNETEFEHWKTGQTGYPMVDAGMRQLNATGYMHNRVRMVVASFLCKHLLIDWRWGEAYFAEKLLDYELAANNGNWQWAAGTGCDAAPYFRVFNPTEQIKKFDKSWDYIRQWVPELDTLEYQQPMVEHKMARLRAIETYKTALNNV